MEVRLCGSSWSECGYCKGGRSHHVNRPPSSSSQSYALLCDKECSTLTYEQLIYRGWRRSGVVFYKPNLETCCPQYTIRLKVDDFIPTKSQRRVWNSMNKLLQEDDREQQSSKDKGNGATKAIEDDHQDIIIQLEARAEAVLSTPVRFAVKPVKKSKQQTITLSTSVCAALAGKDLTKRKTLTAKLAKGLQDHQKDFPGVTDIEVHEPSGHVMVHVKATQSPKQQRNEPRPPSPKKSKTTHKLQEWLGSCNGRPMNFTHETIPATESALLPEVHQLYFVYQHLVHDDADPFTDDKDVSIESHDLSQEAQNMLRGCYSHLPEARQRRITQAYASFYEFLVTSPLKDDQTSKTGTYHQLYRIGGKLIAVGVVDVLPQGLSSVYLFYDPVFARTFVPLGKYAILTEIEWAKNANLPYYYLGYYIHSCPKMTYKADYFPSQLLCPVTFRWKDAKEAKDIISTESPDLNGCRLVQGNDEAFDMDQAMDRVPLKLGAQTIQISMLQPRGKAIIVPMIEELIRNAGPKCASCMVVNLG